MTDLLSNHAFQGKKEKSGLMMKTGLDLPTKKTSARSL
jgi:hypothetical protein